MYTVMTVCTGNICRSPMAEIILRAEFERRGLADKINVESSGVSDEEYGNPIDRRAVKVLKERGYELPAHHFAHRITRDEIERTDLFLPMTASHMRALLRQLPQAKRSEVHMYRSFDPNLRSRPRDVRTASTWWTRGTVVHANSKWRSTNRRGGAIYRRLGRTAVAELIFYCDCGMLDGFKRAAFVFCDLLRFFFGGGLAVL